ncbi:MAG TPA: LysM peptidoglycan-binding domain-containing protein [Gammaproteobacteria bacterium]|nr:LysM peptidoglycan-binding domain-containing protein [Gammaproteobacteria bacterium]
MIKQANGALRLHTYYNAKRAVFAATTGLLAVVAAGCATPPPAEPVIAPEPVEPAPVVQPAPEPVEYVPQAPQRYVVKKGDTLWDISEMFLADPWLWPEIWYVNPQIENPHLIYPGDIITLIWRDGKRYLQIERGGQVVQTTLPGTRLQPQIRTTPLDQAVATIPLDVIAPFLNRSYVISEEELETAPYVLRSVDGRLMTAEGNEIYVRGLDNQKTKRYAVVRVGEPYIDPITDDLLGYEAQFLGEGSIVRRGDPATMQLTASQKEILAGDKLVPAAGSEFNTNFRPHAPDQQVNGQIISVLNGASQIGQYMVVVINRGESDGIEPGHALAIYQRGRVIEDPYSPGLGDENIKLPNERAGVLLVFRTFDNVSYGLVMSATREIHTGDLIRNP